MNAPTTEKKQTKARKKLPETFRRWMGHVRRTRVLKRAVSFVRKQKDAHIAYLKRQKTWLFIPLVGLWTVVFKTVAAPLAALSSDLVFTPLGINRVLLMNPILELADYLTRTLYEVPYLELGWSTLSIACQLLLVAVALPVLVTFSVQLLCLELLSKRVPRVRWRVNLSLVLTGFIYVLAYGELALLVTGAAVAIPLTATFLHWRSRSTVRRAIWVTSAVHIFANAVVVVCRGFFGGV